MEQYITTYQHDYLWREITCPMGAHRMRVDPSVEQGKVDCSAKAYVGEATGRQYEEPWAPCPCGPGGGPPQNAMRSSGVTMPSQDGAGGAVASRLPNLNKEDLAEMMYKAAEAGNIKSGCTPCGNKPDMNPLLPPTGKIMRNAIEPVSCPRHERQRPVPIGQFGGLYEGPLNRGNGELSRVNDQAMPYAFDKPCVCPPGKPESGPQDYGPAWIRSKVEEEAIEQRMTGGKPMPISPDVSRLINPDLPAARVSCAPEADVSKFDQPNTFMRKLYEKYPYLYQLLRDTPPEELIARVFKDRFLSTYQVDYLHMGVGKESHLRGGEQKDEKYISPEGVPEPKMIPGASYRPSRRVNFEKSETGEQKSKDSGGTWRSEKDDESAGTPVVTEERISEYMASISKLGGEIITEKLYALEAKNRAAATARKSVS